MDTNENEPRHHTLMNIKELMLNENGMCLDPDEDGTNATISHRGEHGQTVSWANVS